MMRPTRVEVERSAIKHNLELLKKWNGPDNFFCPMVKANGYGHGDAAVARVIEGTKLASAVGVATYEEGLALRTAGIRIPILVFASIDSVAASALLTHQLTPVVGRFEDLEALLKVGGKLPLSLHVKLNTGMCRLGFDESEIPRLRQILKQNPGLKIEGVCTHLTHGDEAHEQSGFTFKQLARFQNMSAGLPGARHAHKSSSLMTLAAHGLANESKIGARPGIALYGLGTSAPEKMGLKPALRWSTNLWRTHILEKGESVGYSARWTAARKSVIGVVPVGYGDGYHRRLSNNAEMLFRGERVPVVGTVCMDYTFLDLTEACRNGEPQAGEDVVILGRQGANEIQAAWLAEKAGTIDYEIVTSISERVPREVV